LGPLAVAFSGCGHPEAIEGGHGNTALAQSLEDGRAPWKRNK